MSVKMKKLGLMFLSFVMVLGLVGCFDFDDDGIVDPAPNHQRWRMDEYAAHDPSATFFYQWTYVTATNDSDESVALTYAYVYDAEGNLSGVSSMFSMMAENGDTKFYVTRSTDLDKLTYADTTGSNEWEVTLAPGGTVPDYSIENLGVDTYRFKGAMTQANLSAGYEIIKLAYGDYEGSGFDPNTSEITWDLTFNRNSGWYGQQDIEDMNMDTGIIQWNTYMHDADVTGSVSIDGDVYSFDRGYSDQNWGRSFPSGLPSENQEEYMWGWYHLTVPGTDISIIAGVGRNNIALGGISDGIVEAFFSDIRYDGKHLGVRYVDTKRSCPSCSGITILYQASSGSLEDVNITRDPRSEWATLSDNLGDMDFPLNQTVYMETGNVKVTMSFHATLDNSLRFPFFNQGGLIFSDIESLNVNADYKIEEKTGPWYRRRWTTLYEGTVDCAGLEYGYMADVTLP